MPRRKKPNLGKVTGNARRQQNYRDKETPEETTVRTLLFFEV